MIIIITPTSTSFTHTPLSSTSTTFHLTHINLITTVISSPHPHPHSCQPRPTTVPHHHLFSLLTSAPTYVIITQYPGTLALPLHQHTPMPPGPAGLAGSGA
ncbi:hypothetical protein E2C01_039009 [Portunus trituberculatus]|uniref:Uncharacterized protein n=1 Tax=Portunus trituberculatus TaxID=210409 RepID=A0A5B7FJJ6_PORTR|nr:hypothetical protein [Portunus trituberculatus]